MGYNADSYEKVKARKQRFKVDHPDGRIIPEILNMDLDEKAVIKTLIYKNAEDQKNGLPFGVGHALEIRDKNVSVSRKSGEEYESVNYTSWVENCEESSVGRALDNAGYASNQNCSQDEVDKSKRNAAAIGGTIKPVEITVPCAICKEPLVFREKQKFWGCKNYANKSKGIHTSLNIEEYELAKNETEAEMRSVAQDIPF